MVVQDIERLVMAFQSIPSMQIEKVTWEVMEMEFDTFYLS